MTLGPDILLDPLTKDLQLVNGDLVLGADVAQAVRIRFLFVRGEWFRNRNEGIPYYEEIFIKNPKLEQINALFRNSLLRTPGVDKVNSFVASFDVNTRIYTIDWSADTDQGEIDDVVEFTL